MQSPPGLGGSACCDHTPCSHLNRSDWLRVMSAPMGQRGSKAQVFRTETGEGRIFSLLRRQLSSAKPALPILSVRLRGHNLGDLLLGLLSRGRPPPCSCSPVRTVWMAGLSGARRRRTPAFSVGVGVGAGVGMISCCLLGCGLIRRVSLLEEFGHFIKDQVEVNCKHNCGKKAKNSSCFVSSI